MSRDREKSFSIQDAFEEETDEAIKVYGTTITPIRSKARSPDDVTIRVDDPRHYKYNEDTTSRDSDSLIQEYGNLSTLERNTYCWRHPKVRENWKIVLGAVLLTIIGCSLITLGIFVYSSNSSQAIVIFVVGFLCFIPGAYHVVYIWLAARGCRGFDFYHLPLFR